MYLCDYFALIVFKKEVLNLIGTYVSLEVTIVDILSVDGFVLEFGRHKGSARGLL